MPLMCVKEREQLHDVQWWPATHSHFLIKVLTAPFVPCTQRKELSSTQPCSHKGSLHGTQFPNLQNLCGRTSCHRLGTTSRELQGTGLTGNSRATGILFSFRKLLLGGEWLRCAWSRTTTLLLIDNSVYTS